MATATTSDGTSVERKLAPADARFVVRELRVLKGRGTRWWVYDRARGCYQQENPALGKGRLPQELETEAEAQAEADRLNTLVLGTAINAAPKAKKGAKKAPAPASASDELELSADDLPDYGVMSESDREKYEDGLLEKVGY